MFNALFVAFKLLTQVLFNNIVWNDISNDHFHGLWFPVCVIQLNLPMTIICLVTISLPVKIIRHIIKLMKLKCIKKLVINTKTWIRHEIKFHQIFASIGVWSQNPVNGWNLHTVYSVKVQNSVDWLPTLLLVGWLMVVDLIYLNLRHFCLLWSVLGLYITDI